MTLSVFEHRAILHRPILHLLNLHWPNLNRRERTGGGGQDRLYRVGKSRSAPLGIGIFCAVTLAQSPALAADSTTCSMAVKLLEAVDKGVEAAAAGDARAATSGIAIFAQQTQDMANLYSQNDPLPDDVVAALTAVLAETATQYFIADAAAVLLQQALVIQQAMPEICPTSEVPDLNRHAN